MTLDIAIASACPRRGGTLVDCVGPVLRADGCFWPVGQLVSFGRPPRLAQCIGFDRGLALLAPLTDPEGISRGMPVMGVAERPASIDIPLGMVIDALGKRIASLGNNHGRMLPVAAKLAVECRAPVNAPFFTAIRVIDTLLTVGRGQRLTLAAPAGAGKTTLIQQLVKNSQADAIVIGLVGERGREVADFARIMRSATIGDRTVIVAATSDQAPALRLRAAVRAHEIAEALRAAGKSVLLVIDSLTRAAQAQRELGLAMGEPAGIGAYPPSAFALIPQLVERAGGDIQTDGAITAFYTVLAEAGDADDPIVDAARAATDGHIVLSRNLAAMGVFPAIDIAASISRTMMAVVDESHWRDACTVRRLWATAEEYRELQLLGAYSRGQDVAVDDVLRRRDDLLAFVAQPVDSSVAFGDARRALAGLCAS